MKKLLIITDLFPHKYNPNSEVFVRQQAEELSNRYEVRVVATRFRYRFAVETEITERFSITYVFMPVIRYLHLSMLFFYQVLAVPVIKKVIREWSPDLIHVHDYRHVPELTLLYYCLSKYNIPRYLTLHNIRTHPVMVKSILFKWFYGLCVKQAYSGWNNIFTVNDRIKDIIIRDAGVSAITNIGNGIGPVPTIDDNLLRSARDFLLPDSYKIISVGNLKKEKGFDFLIRAVKILVDKGYDIRLMIVGRGEEGKYLQKLVIELGLSDRVNLIGDLGNDVVRNMYPLFDAFVLASYSETFGIVYIEAMYAGLPVIGVKGQGIDGIVRNADNGLLALPRDVNDLADKIQSLISDPESAAVIAEKGRQTVEKNYLLEQLAAKIAKIYES